MAIAVAASWSGNAAVIFKDIAVSGINAGELLVVATCGFTVDPDLPTDNGTNTWTERVQSVGDATFRCRVAIADCIVGTPPTTVTVNTPGGASVAGVVWRVTGNDASPYDTSAANNSALDDPTTSAITNAQADTLFVAALTHDGGTTTLAAQGGWSDDQEVENAAVFPFSGVSKVVSSIASTSHQWTTGAAADYSMAIAAYKAVAVVTSEASLVQQSDRLRKVQRAIY